MEYEHANSWLNFTSSECVFWDDIWIYCEKSGAVGMPTQILLAIDLSLYLFSIRQVF